jgi:hypothetical protein
MSIFESQEKLASDFLDRKKVLVIHKATRTAATYSLIKVALERGLKVVVFTPTKRIFREIRQKMPAIYRKPFKMALIGPNTEICRKLDPKLKFS